jgi:hypothetical protein
MTPDSMSFHLLCWIHPSLSGSGGSQGNAKCPK